MRARLCVKRGRQRLPRSPRGPAGVPASPDTSSPRFGLGRTAGPAIIGGGAGVFQRAGADMASEKATGLVIRTTDWSETSRIATVWTRESGKVRVLAKGGRRLRSNFEVALDLLSVC